ncbi:hypothetical protein MHU86_1866 [Fragilaria crotonensis]|nr:hypothetical protein MHU86_1866 [Fragilaria crotonensis]
MPFGLRLGNRLLPCCRCWSFCSDGRQNADIFTSMRCKLLTIIRNWEASGQGDGGMDREQDGEGDEQVLDDYGGLDRGQQDGGDEEDDNNETSSMAQAFVSLRQRPARALDNRAAFLRGMPSYILYYWEVAESQQLLSSCLQRLSNHANASDASSVALVSRRGGTTSSRSNITSSGGSSRSGSRGGRSQNADEETDDDEMTNTTSAENPLVQSLQDLVDSQRRLLSDRALDRNIRSVRTLGNDVLIVAPFWLMRLACIE